MPEKAWAWLKSGSRSKRRYGAGKGSLPQAQRGLSCPVRSGHRERDQEDPGGPGRPERSGNRFSSTVIVAAITSKGDADEPYPTEVLVRAKEGGLSRDSVIRLDQIRTVDKRRLVRRLGSVSPATMARVNRAIQISLALIDV